MVKLLLEMFGVSYIPVESLPQQERIRLLESVLDLAGFEKIGLEEAGGERLAEVDVPRLSIPRTLRTLSRAAPRCNLPGNPAGARRSCSRRDVPLSHGHDRIVRPAQAAFRE